MRRPSRNIEIFSMSALDLFACALGAFILIAIMLFPFYNEDKALMQRAEAAEESARLATAARDAAELSEEEARAAAEAAARAQAEAEEEAAKRAAEAREAAEAAEASRLAAEEADTAREEAEAEAAAAAEMLAEAEQWAAEVEQAKAELADQVEQLRLEVARTFLIVMMEWEVDSDVDLHVTDPEGREFYYAKANRGDMGSPKIYETDSQLTLDNAYGPGVEIWQAPEATPGEYRVAFNLYRPPRAAAVLVPVTVKGSILYRNGVERLPEVVLTQRGERFETTVTVTENGTIEIAPQS